MCFWKRLGSILGVSVAIPPYNYDSQSRLASWLLEWFAQAPEFDKSVMVQAVYSLWLARNEARDGRKIAEPHEISLSVAAYVREWEEIHKKEVNPRAARGREAWDRRRWAGSKPMQMDRFPSTGRRGALVWCCEITQVLSEQLRAISWDM